MLKAALFYAHLIFLIGLNFSAQATSPGAQTSAGDVKQISSAVDAGSGWLNLHRLLESPHKNSYPWAALTLLGVLIVGAGLKIQGRKTSLTSSTLTPPSEPTEFHRSPISTSHLELPADIAALNLDLSAKTPQLASEYASPALTKTLQ